MRIAKSASGTGIETATAGTTLAGNRLIIFQFQIGEDFTQNQPGTETLVNQQSVFAYPAETSTGGVGLFGQGSGIHKTAEPTLINSINLNALDKLFKVIFHYPVIN